MEVQGKTNQKSKSILTQVVEENKEIKSQITELTSAFTYKSESSFYPSLSLIQRGSTWHKPQILTRKTLKRSMPL